MEEPRLRVLLVDDHPSVLRGVGEALGQHFGPTVQATSYRTVAEALATRSPVDVVVLDVQLNDGSLPQQNVAGFVQRGWPVLLYTQECNPVLIARCLNAGAAGVVGKNEDLDVLAAAVEGVVRGEPHLSQEWAAALEDGYITAPGHVFQPR